MSVVMRTTLPPAALSGTIQRVVREVDAAVPVVRLRDMDSVFAESIRRPRLLAQLRSEEHTSELQSRLHLVCRLLLEKKKKTTRSEYPLCPRHCPSVLI